MTNGPLHVYVRVCACVCVCLCVCRVVVQPPPKSLEELLERQWEQTAQFILDQAGSKNNGKEGGRGR